MTYEKLDVPVPMFLTVLFTVMPAPVAKLAGAETELIMRSTPLVIETALVKAVLFA